jgi:hypothetical protein
MLPLCEYPADAPLAALFESACVRLKPQWNADSILTAPEFVFASDGQRLLFGLRSQTAAVCTDTPAGRFISGLWEHDVAELFIMDRDGIAYQEINLSPTGAWWTMKFSSERKADLSNFNMPRRVETFSRCGNSSWCSAIAIHLSELSISFDPGIATRANVAAIIGKSPRHYFSWCLFESEAPEFHATRDFEGVELVSGG